MTTPARLPVRLTNTMTALALLLGAAGFLVLDGGTDAAAGPSDESASILMPFEGAWANDFSTAPWEHGRTIAEDWTMDVFAPSTDVHARIGRTTGQVTLEIAPPDSYGCVGAGSMVWVTVVVDGTTLGRFGYHHLVDIEYPAGATLIDTSSARLGRTAPTPFSLGGNCWNVSTDAGIHAHLVLDNAVGYSCYAPHTRGEILGTNDTLAVLGGADGAPWADGPRERCDDAALEAGQPELDDRTPETLASESPYLFRTLAAGHFVNDFQSATHSRSGETLVVWHEYDGNATSGTSFSQRLSPEARPLDQPRELSASSPALVVRVDDVIGRTDSDGWTIIGDESAGTVAGERLVLRQLGADGTTLNSGTVVDEGRAIIGRLVRDTVSGDLMVAWTRPLDTGFQVMLARYDHAGTTVLAGPDIVQTGGPGDGLGVEDVITDPVTGSTYLLTQSGTLDGDGVLTLQRSLIRIAPGGSSAQHSVVPPAGTSFTQSHGAVDTTGSLLVATHRSAIDGTNSTVYELWEPGQAAPTSIAGPPSTERPTVLAASGAGADATTPAAFDLVHSLPHDGTAERLFTSQYREGSFGEPRLTSAPVHADATLGDLRASRSPLDGTTVVVTRERLDGQIRLASAADRHDLATTAPGPVRNLRLATQPTAPLRASAPGERVRVSWDPPATTGGASVIDYVVDVNPGGHRVVVDAATTSTIVSGLVGGSLHHVTVTARNSVGAGPGVEPATIFVPVRPLEGYWMLEGDGTVHSFGDAKVHGHADVGQASAVAITPTPNGDGYWVLDDAGLVHAFGDAPHLGDLGFHALTLEVGETAATMSATPSGDGYWIFTTRGRALSYGAAVHYGDVAHLELNGPIIDSVATPSGRGYFQVAADGGVFASGDAAFAGSIQGVVDGRAPGTTATDWLAAPIVGLVPTPANDGYWLVAADGGTFSFGRATFRGSVPEALPGIRLNQPVNGMVRYGDGYVMVAADGGVFVFSNQTFLGSLGDTELDAAVTAIAPIGS